MKKSEIVKLAKQGHHQAIGLLLNHSLKAHGIQAIVGEHAGTLHILLEGQAAPAQETYGKMIHQGLQKLDITVIDKAHIYGRPAGNQAYAWKTIVSLKENTILDQSQLTLPPSQLSRSRSARPQPPRPAQPTATPKPSPVNPALKPGWGFWCGWMLVSILGSAIAFLSLYYFEGRIERSYGTAKVIVSWLTFISGGGIGLLVGWGQETVLRREFPNSHLWLIRTVVGTLISTTLGFFWSGYYRAVPTLPNAIMLWMLMVLPIVTCQWTLLRSKIINAWLWVVVPTIAGTAIGLTLNFALPSPFNLFDTVIITRWLFYAIGGGLMIWLLRDNANVVAPPAPSNPTTYRQILQRRSRFNHRFVLEWVGLTLAGWFAGRWLLAFLPFESVFATVGRISLRLLQGLPPAVFMPTYGIIIELPTVLSLLIWFGLISTLQWLTLRRRLTEAKDWLIYSFNALAIGSGAVLIIKAIAVLMQNWGNLGSAIIQPWLLPNTFELSLPGLIMAIPWGVSILAQAYFWQRHKFAVATWLAANLGACALVTLLPMLQDDFHLPAISPFVAVTLPALAIAWMAAYAHPTLPNRSPKAKSKSHENLTARLR
ncbi:MAG: hypothetical protein AAF827_09450 [Cyanobacteria bacterium P01_D01_bin.6]